MYFSPFNKLKWSALSIAFYFSCRLFDALFMYCTQYIFTSKLIKTNWYSQLILISSDNFECAMNESTRVWFQVLAIQSNGHSVVVIVNLRKIHKRSTIILFWCASVRMIRMLFSLEQTTCICVCVTAWEHNNYPIFENNIKPKIENIYLRL